MIVEHTVTPHHLPLICREAGVGNFPPVCVCHFTRHRTMGKSSSRITEFVTDVVVLEKLSGKLKQRSATQETEKRLQLS
jgi:hypothetical protein